MLTFSVSQAKAVAAANAKLGATLAVSSDLESSVAAKFGLLHTWISLKVLTSRLCLQEGVGRAPVRGACCAAGADHGGGGEGNGAQEGTGWNAIAGKDDDLGWGWHGVGIRCSLGSPRRLWPGLASLRTFIYAPNQQGIPHPWNK